MEFVLKRIAKQKGYTIGKLYIKEPIIDEYLRGEKFIYLCDTLEPQWRDYAKGAYKVKGKSAIPEGRYAVVITYSPKFKKWLPLLLGVNNFSGIRIHAGNTVKDTQGCILVGENKEVGKVLNSRVTFERLYKKLQESKDNNIYITIE